MTQEMALGGLFAAFGALILTAMLMDWEWIFRMRRMDFLVRILSRMGVRILYSLIAVTMIVCGILVATGVIEPPKKYPACKAPGPTTMKGTDRCNPTTSSTCPYSPSQF